MRKWIIIVVIIGMLGWTGWEFYTSQQEKTNIEDLQGIQADPNADTSDSNLADVEEGLEKGDMAPDFELQTIDGETVRLSDFRGEKVMLNFWATWCPPCRAEMPDMQKFHENKDVTILAVDLFDTESKIEDVEEFMDDYGVTFKVLLDEGSTVSTKYGIQPIPTSYMINSKGVIENMAFGALNYELMVQELDKMD